MRNSENEGWENDGIVTAVEPLLVQCRTSIQDIEHSGGIPFDCRDIKKWVSENGDGFGRTYRFVEPLMHWSFKGTKWENMTPEQVKEEAEAGVGLGNEILTFFGPNKVSSRLKCYRPECNHQRVTRFLADGPTHVMRHGEKTRWPCEKCGMSMLQAVRQKAPRNNECSDDINYGNFGGHIKSHPSFHHG